MNSQFGVFYVNLRCLIQCNFRKYSPPAMKEKLLLFSLFLLFILPGAAAQDRLKIKFGNVTPADFKPIAYLIDSSANAIVIADIGVSEIVGNTKGSVSLLFKNYRRARILNKNGYDFADVEIFLYADGDAEEELENLKAVTYNLENGKVVETKLEVKSSVFKDKLNKNLVVKKFTFPNIREGSIIEYEYRIKSDFIRNLQPWEFQGRYPRLWSEYTVTIPEFMNYVTLSQGYHPFAVKDQKDRRSSFSIADNRNASSSDRSSFTAGVTDFHWVMKDVPALREEGFTSTLENHISKIEFQLSSLRDPFVPKTFMDSWANVSRMLMEDERFGQQLTKDNGWLSDMVKEATRNATSATDKARNIYSWVRDNLTCTVPAGTLMQQTLRNVLKSRNGNVPEINLLLTAMLRKAGLQADPVMLSTRSHGYVHSIYPLMDRFNYVISHIVADDKEYFLDASETGLGFGKLDYKCYNGHARVINEEATPVELIADSLKETTSTAVFIINDENGKLIGSLQQTPGYYASLQVRQEVKQDGKEKYIKGIEKSMSGFESTIQNARFDSLDKYEEPVGIFYDFAIKPAQEDVIYFNPMLSEGFKENPFKSAQRFYPVEMPYTMDQVYTLQMEIPKGYDVDELPKQTVVKFNEEGDAVFEYRISANGNSIMLRSRVQIKRAYFDPEEYEILREFFNMIVKKHNEQIVFKKKK
jgi:hypothetical protein